MLDIITPQRFYQFKFQTGYEDTVSTVIDLKVVTEISLIENKHRKEIAINTGSSHHPPRVIILEESEVATEVYSKLVSAWTTYKLATER